MSIRWPTPMYRGRRHRPCETEPPVSTREEEHPILCIPRRSRHQRDKIPYYEGQHRDAQRLRDLPDLPEVGRARPPLLGRAPVAPVDAEEGAPPMQRTAEISYNQEPISKCRFCAAYSPSKCHSS